MTHDIADDGFHEIQLSGKQLVFLFMATTAVSVMIFLLGVLVGRDVRGGRVSEATEAALTTPAPSPAPAPDPVKPQAAAPAEPPSPPAADELTYRKRLESDGASKETLKPQGTSARTDATPEPARPQPSDPPAEPAAKVGTTKAAAAAAAAVPPAAAPAGRPGRWVVQLVALRDRAAAASIAQRLSGRGYPAFIVNPAASTPNQVYKVQVGRYDDKNEAERVAKRLEKEEKFSPWISR